MNEEHKGYIYSRKSEGVFNVIEYDMTFHSKDVGMRTVLDYGMLDISGNELHGFRPYQLMVASIVGCSSGVFQKILEKQRVIIEDMQVQTKVERNPDEANRVEKIKIHYIVKGNHLDPQKLDKSLEVARRNCSMIRTVEDMIDIEESLEVIRLSI